MRTALAYTPRRGRLQGASVSAVAVYLGSLVLVAFAFSNPIVLGGAGAAVAAAGIAAGARAAVTVSIRWGVWLGATIVAVNALVTDRGDTVLVRGYDVPVLGPMDVTLESLAAGAVLAERILVVTIAFAVWSACVDPDRVLRVVRPLARRSALTATLVSRLVPVAAGDLGRLREAAVLRGPGAAPAGSWPARSIARWTSRRRSSSAATRSAGARRRNARGARATTGGSSLRASRSASAASPGYSPTPVGLTRIRKWRWMLTQRRWPSPPAFR
jgi:energy-coupling factor transport system permease protein